MAEVTKTISSLQRKWTDLDFNFSRNPGNSDVTKKTNTDAVKQSIRNLLLTKQFERPFQPNLYSQLYDLLFELFTPTIKYTLESVISNVITNYEPRASIISVTVNPTPESNALDVTLVFTVIGVNVPVTYTVSLERTR